MKLTIQHIYYSDSDEEEKGFCIVLSNDTEIYTSMKELIDRVDTTDRDSVTLASGCAILILNALRDLHETEARSSDLVEHDFYNKILKFIHGM